MSATILQFAPIVKAPVPLCPCGCRLEVKRNDAFAGYEHAMDYYREYRPEFVKTAIHSHRQNG